MPRRGALSADALAAVRQLEIKTKRLLRGLLPGGARSVQKGVGFDFDQIREYQMGDDVRFIDWSGSARMDTLLVKHYIQEQSRVFIIALDVSRSTWFASGNDRKCDTMAQVATVLTFIADYRNDYVGLILFTQKVELYVAPRKGKQHVHMLISLIHSYEPKGERTCFEAVFKKLAEINRKDAIVLVLSDFIGELSMRYCAVVSHLYMAVMIRCLDKRESELPAIGFVSLCDIETGELVDIDTRGTPMRAVLASRIREQDAFFKKYGMEVLNVSSERSFVSDMVRFFTRYIR